MIFRRKFIRGKTNWTVFSTHIFQSLASYAYGGGVGEVVLAGAIGAAPDIIGAYGNLVKRDEYKLYNKAHSDLYGIFFLLAGNLLAILYAVSDVSVLAAFSIGCYGYVVHLLLDKVSHGEGKRWWLWSERAFLNYSLWFVLCVIALFVNPINPWFSVVGGIWACLVAAYCHVKYN